MADKITTEAIRKKIQGDVFDSYYQNKKIAKIREWIKDGKGRPSDMYTLADELADIISKSFNKYLGDVAVDGKIAEGIANAVVGSSLRDASEILGKDYAIYQNAFNERLGTSLRAVELKPNTDRIVGFCKKVSSANYDDIAWMNDAPVRNFTRNTVIEQMKANAQFLDSVGFETKIVRKLGPGGCCEWCKQLAGTYTMPDVPSEVFQAHDRCDCEIEVVSNKGSYFMRKSGHGFSKY